MSEHKTQEPEMVVIEIEKIRKRLMESGMNLIDDDNDENPLADTERFLDPYDDVIDIRSETQRAEDEKKDFESRFTNCEDLVKVYNNRVEKLEHRQKFHDQKFVKTLLLICVPLILGLNIYLAKHGTGNMGKDMVLSLLWVPVGALFVLVFWFLGPDVEKKERTDYKWLTENLFPIIYEKYTQKKIPSIEFQKNIARLFPNGKKADYGYGIENRVVEMCETEVTAVDKLSSKHGKEYTSFKGICIYNRLNGKYQLVSGMSFLPPFEKGKAVDKADIWTYYIIAENAKRKVL